MHANLLPPTTLMISKFLTDGLTPPGVCASRRETAPEKSGDDSDLSDKGNPGCELSKKALAFLSFQFFSKKNSNREKHLLIQLYWDFLLPCTSEHRHRSRRLPWLGELFIPLLKWSRSFSPLHASRIISEYVLSLTTNFKLLEKEKRKRHEIFFHFFCTPSLTHTHPTQQKSLAISAHLTSIF